MILIPPNIDVPEADSFANDLLGRRKISDALTELLKANTQALVMCLNAEWGAGKTTFLRMWRQVLINITFERFTLTLDQ